MQLRCGDYRLEYVYRRTRPEQRAEAVAFWLAHGALADQRVAQGRAFELVYLVRRGDGLLAGMSTAALQRAADGRHYYVYRMFLGAPDRVPYLMGIVTHASRERLREFAAVAPKPAGMLIVTENLKLMRPGIQRYAQRHGYVLRGRTRRGLDVWLAPFEEAGTDGRTAEK